MSGGPKATSVWNVPNTLSIARIGTLPLFIGTFYATPSCGALAAAFFSLSALTDLADGALARLLHQKTSFGAWLDPVADKLVVTASLALLVEKFHCPSITLPCLLIIVREVGVSGLRELYAVSQSSRKDDSEKSSRRLSVGKLGKWKTACQLVSIIMLLYYAEGTEKNGTNEKKSTQDGRDHWMEVQSKALETSVRSNFGEWAACTNRALFYTGGIGVLWAAAGLSVVSGMQYGRVVWTTRTLL